MNVIVFLIIILSITPVYAEIYKCEDNGKTSYQSNPCKNKGKIFKLQQDISPEQQRAAVAKLKSELAARAEIERIAKENYNKERSIRAKEETARAIQLIAKNTARQADALELKNRIDSTTPGLYRQYYPKKRLK